MGISGNDVFRILSYLCGASIITTFAVHYAGMGQGVVMNSVVISIILASITVYAYTIRCPRCGEFLTMRKIGGGVIDRWSEQWDYEKKTIYLYSDGMTEKYTKSEPRTFTGRYELREEEMECFKCGERKTRRWRVFLNESEWRRAGEPERIITKTNPPRMGEGKNAREFRRRVIGRRVCLNREFGRRLRGE